MSPYVTALLIPVVLCGVGTVLVLRGKSWPALLIAAALLLTGIYLGLAWAPPEAMMGDVQRIMYMHVPSVWMALLAMVLNFLCSVRRLMDSRPMLLVGAGLGVATVLLGVVLRFAMADEANAKNAMIYCITFGILFAVGAWVGSRIKSDLTSDALAEASAEIGLVFGANGVLLGSIWARPTWGVWWDWDPRLTSAAILLVAYSGYLALRKFVDDADKRAVWSAVVAIVSFVDVPIIYFSVRWWRSLHQIQSTPETISDPRMRFVLRFCAFTFLLIMIIWTRQRYLNARKALELETTVPDALPSVRAGEAA
ncbi:MAG: cytochrome c biogenesis protein [Myxococcaceae bacterium]